VIIDRKESLSKLIEDIFNKNYKKKLTEEKSTIFALKLPGRTELYEGDIKIDSISFLKERADSQKKIEFLFVKKNVIPTEYEIPESVLNAQKKAKSPLLNLLMMSFMKEMFCNN